VRAPGLTLESWSEPEHQTHLMVSLSNHEVVPASHPHAAGSISIEQAAVFEIGMW